MKRYAIHICIPVASEIIREHTNQECDRGGCPEKAIGYAKFPSGYVALCQEHLKEEEEMAAK